MKDFSIPLKKADVCTAEIHGEFESALQYAFLCQHWSIVLFGGAFFILQLHQNG